MQTFWGEVVLERNLMIIDLCVDNYNRSQQQYQADSPNKQRTLSGGSDVRERFPGCSYATACLRKL